MGGPPADQYVLFGESGLSGERRALPSTPAKLSKFKSRDCLTVQRNQSCNLPSATDDLSNKADGAPKCGMRFNCQTPLPSNPPFHPSAFYLNTKTVSPHFFHYGLYFLIATKNWNTPIQSQPFCVKKRGSF